MRRMQRNSERAIRRGFATEDDCGIIKTVTTWLHLISFLSLGPASDSSRAHLFLTRPLPVCPLSGGRQLSGSASTGTSGYEFAYVQTQAQRPAPRRIFASSLPKLALAFSSDAIVAACWLYSSLVCIALWLSRAGQDTIGYNKLTSSLTDVNRDCSQCVHSE